MVIIVLLGHSMKSGVHLLECSLGLSEFLLCNLYLPCSVHYSQDVMELKGTYGNVNKHRVGVIFLYL